MAQGDADVGTGILMTLVSSGEVLEVLDINFDGMTREAIETTHMQTTDARRFMPSKLPDYGSMTIQYNWTPNRVPLIANAAETVRLEWSIMTPGNTQKAKWESTMFVTSDSASMPVEGKRVGTLVFKIDGKPVVTPEAA